MSIIISDAERVRQNAANKKDLRLPPNQLNDIPIMDTSFGGPASIDPRLGINCKKVAQRIRKNKYLQSRPSWR